MTEPSADLKHPITGRPEPRRSRVRRNRRLVVPGPLALVAVPALVLSLGGVAASINSSPSSAQAADAGAAAITEGQVCEQVGYVLSVMQHQDVIAADGSDSYLGSVQALYTSTQNLDASLSAASRQVFVRVGRALQDSVAGNRAQFYAFPAVTVGLVQPAERRCGADALTRDLNLGLATNP